MTEAEWLACDDPAAMLDAVNKLPTSSPALAYAHVSDRQLRLFACACCRQVWHLLTDPRSRAAIEVAERFADGLATNEERMAGYECLPRPSDADFVSSGAQLVTNLLMPDGMRQESVIGELLHNASRRCGYCRGTGREMSYPESADDPPPASITCRECRGLGVVCVVGSGPLPYRLQAALLRDIVGNPFRPVTVQRKAKCRTCRGSGELTTSHRFDCYDCNGTGKTGEDAAWLTPTVQALAQAAYDERRADGTLDPDRLGVLSDALEEAGCGEEALLRHLRGWERCFRGHWPAKPKTMREAYTQVDPTQVQTACVTCQGTGWVKLPGPHVRGCWALSLILGQD